MDNSFELPPLPETDWQLYQPAGWYEPAFISTQDGYTAEQMRAYALAAVEAEREAFAKVCKDHQNMREATGHPREASTARKLAEMIRARGKT